MFNRLLAVNYSIIPKKNMKDIFNSKTHKHMLNKLFAYTIATTDVFPLQ